MRGDQIIVDCDVHPMTRSGWSDIEEYVPSRWRERARAALHDTVMGPRCTPSVIADSNKGANFAADTVAPDGSRPGSDPEFSRQQLLEAHGIDCAVLSSLESIALSNVGDADATVHLARAYNDYFIEHWLGSDSRFQLAIGLPPRDAEAGAAEIARLAGVPGVVAVILPFEARIGHPDYHPIYEAAEAARLPIITHPGQASTFGSPLRAAGSPPSTYSQAHAVLCQIAMTNVASIVLEGTTVRFPDLRFVFVEYGFSWLVHLLWRMDSNWRSLYAETPWLVEPPSTYVRRSVRLTTQPIDQPPRKGDLAAVIEMIHGEEILMYSTDYPHWDNEFPNNALAGLPEDVKRRLFAENALETFPKIRVPALVGNTGG